MLLCISAVMCWLVLCVAENNRDSSRGGTGGLCVDFLKYVTS